MKSLQMNDYGDIDEVTELVEKEMPSPSSDQALVKMIASPIHPSDTFLISGDYPRRVEFPHVMGNEGIGKVVELGSEVDTLSKDDVVLIPVGTPAWQTHMIIEADRLVALPVQNREIQLQLAMTAINPPTAYLMLHEFVDLQEGDWIVQNAANSSVGRYVIQLAADMGVKSVNIVRRSELKEELEALGADVVVVDGGDVHRQVRDIVGDGTVKLGIDAVAGPASTRLLQCLSEGATMIVYGSMSKQPVKLNVGAMLGKNPKVKSFWLSKWYQETDPGKVMPLLQKIGGMIASGKLSTKIAKTFSLDEYKQALHYAEKEAKGGKVLFAEFD